MKRRSKVVAMGVLAIALIVVAAAPGWAQSGTTSLSGRVMDEQGGVMPGVSVTLTRVSTAATRHAVTNDSGVYRFNGLAPDVYELLVSLEGFRTSRVENLELRVDTPVKHDVELALGEMTEELTVTAEAPLVNTADASMGNTLEERAIADLPVEGRSVVELLSLQPGAVFIPFATGITDDTDPRYGAVSGARVDQQNITLDGVDVNDPELATAYSSAVRVTQEALQEFRVSTSNYGAEYGRSSGPQVSMVTKSGSNEFHGSGYWFLRDTSTSSNEYFLKLSQAGAGDNTPPQLDKNIFGGSLGGPIIKDRVFFYANFETLSEKSEAPAVREVPTGSFRDGILMYQCEDPGSCPGGSVNGFTGSHSVPAGWYGLTPAEAAGIDPLGIGPSRAAAEYFSLFPLPNEPGRYENNWAGYRFAAPLENSFKTYIARLDAKLNESGSHNVFLRFNAQDDAINDSPQYPGEPPSESALYKNWGMALGYDWVISSNLVSTFRYGFTKINEEIVGTMTGEYANFRFLDDINPQTATESRMTPTHNIVEQLSWLTGDHTVKAGINYRRTRVPSSRNSGSFNNVGANGSWVFGVGRTYQPGRSGCTSPGCNAVPAVAESFSAGYGDPWLAYLAVMSQANLNANYDRDGNLLPSGTPVEREYGSDEYEIFVQDAWQLRPNLTVTLGLRYSLYSPPWEVNGLQVAPDINMGDWFAERGQFGEQGIPSSQSPLISFDLAGPANNGPGFYEWDKNNIAPAVSFVWMPQDDTVVRAGYYKVFDRVGLGLARQFDRNNSFGMATAISSPWGDAYEEMPEARFVDLQTLPPTLPTAPAGGFPQTPPVGANEITGNIDQSLVTPNAHVVNLAISRQLGSDFSIEAAYIGRFGRDQILRRDLSMPLNLTDPESGTDYFTAAQQLIGASLGAGLTENSDASAFAALAPQAYWENLFPDMAGVWGEGLTATQAAAHLYMLTSPDYITALWLMDLDGWPAASRFGPFAYFSEQYGSLASISSLGRSNYNALQLTLRKRMSHGIQFDLNYTFSQSKDQGSSASRGSGYGNTTDTGGNSEFITNSWDLDSWYGRSNYNLTHQVNVNWIWDMPFGEGRRFGGGASGALNQVIGNWSLSGLVRMATGFPFNVTNCRSCWPTNWNVGSNAMLQDPSSLPPLGTTMNAVDGRPSMFTDPVGARDFFRYALPGEQSMRNQFTGDGYFTIDLSLSKAWNIGIRDHKLRFRADVFNATNTPTFDVVGMTANPDRTGFGRYNRTFATCDGRAGRCMQFALRYEF